MSLLPPAIRNSPAWVRVLPFVVFVVLTYCQGKWGEPSRYWFYLAKSGVGAVLLWMVWPWVRELRFQVSWAAVAAGVGVFVFWVGLDGLYPGLDVLMRQYICPGLRKLGLGGLCTASAQESLPWNPHQQFEGNAVLVWLFIGVRLLGSTLVVPPLEEVFYRSFLYRYIAKPEFESVPLGQFKWMPFLVTSLLFGLSHREWLAGILCGFVYQGLVVAKGRLGDAVTAHALTNLLLGLWVVSRGAWRFW